MNSRYTEVASSDQIDQAITHMATEILENNTQTPLFVALLRGAAPFATRLMTEIVRQQPDYHPELDYMMVSTYGDGRQAGEPHIVTDLAPNTTVRDRSVIVLDDVLDKGITAQFVISHLNSRGAKNVQLAVLCEKQAQRVSDIAADYCGFSFTDEWLVGMGLDDSSVATEGYRWLDKIWQVKP